MNEEKKYTNSVTTEHIKTLGQYFTNYDVADFMCSWACSNANSVLDPSVGNSVFLNHARKHNLNCKLTGYEIDSVILDFFKNPSNAEIYNEDYLLNGWDKKYDAIVCNPPYNRFQSISNRNEILKVIYNYTGIQYSGYTNQYILFLIKSIFQLSENGRLAYIIPSEFMNSQYGESIKKILIDKKMLRAIINFKNNSEMFFNATTTCCILLIDYEHKDDVVFFNLNSIDELKSEIDINDLGSSKNALHIEFEQLKSTEKWRSYLNQEEKVEYSNLKKILNFCSVSRGIATGANDYFCFSRSKAQNYAIPEKYLTKCICRSADVKKPIFDNLDFDKLSDNDKTVYLLDITPLDSMNIESYLKFGKEMGIDKKYLPSSRKVWYTMEQKNSADIWVTSACRNGIKFIRNLAEVKALTTFHSIFINDEYSDYKDIIFCYFLTPVAQSIIRENRKELGNGLEKFQPNDLNSAEMLDVKIITSEDKDSILEFYEQIKKGNVESSIDELNKIFLAYLQ